MKRFLWLGFVASVYLICTGCGDTFRPIIIPNPPTFPNPRAAHSVLTLSHNFECLDQACDDGDALVPGSAMVIDVSGDSDVSVVDVNLAPIHAAQQSASQVLVVNQAVTGVTPPPSGCLVLVQTPPQTLNVCPSLTKLIFNGTVISSTNTLTLPPSSAANFVAVAPLDTTAYVSLPTYVPDPVGNPTHIVPSVVAINTQSNQLLLPPMTVGNNPVALAVTPDKSKLYVANEGDSTLSAFNTVDRSNRGVSPANTSSPPIWLVARTDNQRVYVLEDSGVLASIDTTATAGPDPLTEYPGISVPGATTMVYDSNKNRLYIPGGPVMAIVDVSQSAPRLMATITIPNVPALPNSVPASAVAAASLPDATRAYVASIPNVALSSQATVSAVQGDGTNATYTYTWTGGHDLAPGITVTVAGIPSPNDAFNGTYAIIATSGTSCDQPTQVCTFQAANPKVLSTKATVTGSVASTGDNLFPQITVVDVSSNTIKSSLNTSGFPDATVPSSPYYAPICATTRFRFMMAAGGDSTRTYLSSCDGGNVNIIDTGADKYVLNLPAPIGARTPIPPSLLNPPQNPVFLIAGP